MIYFVESKSKNDKKCYGITTAINLKFDIEEMLVPESVGDALLNGEDNVGPEQETTSSTWIS